MTQPDPIEARALELAREYNILCPNTDVALLRIIVALEQRVYKLEQLLETKQDDLLKLVLKP